MVETKTVLKGAIGCILCCALLRVQFYGILFETFKSLTYQDSFHFSFQFSFFSHFS